MKKLGIVIALLLVFSFLPGLISCAKAPAPTAPTTPTKPTTPTQPTAPTAPTAAPKAIKLKFADWDPGASVYVRATVEPWIKLIERETGGRVKIDYFGAETLAKRPDLYDALLNGIADITLFATAMNPGRFPLAEIAELPFLYKSSVTTGLTMWETYKSGGFGKDFSNVRIIGFRPNDVSNITSRTKPMKTAADWKGQKMGGSGVVQQGLAELMGATFVALGSPERYDALQKGMIDFTILEWEGQFIWKFYEVTKYRTTGADITILAPMFYAMSIPTYEKLPADIKAIIDKYSGEWLTKVATVNMDRENFWRFQMVVDYDKQKGLDPVYMLPKEERDKWINMMTPLYDKMIKEREAKGLPAKATFDKIKELSAKYEAMYPPGSDVEYKLWQEFGKDSVFPGYPKEFVLPKR